VVVLLPSCDFVPEICEFVFEDLFGLLCGIDCIGRGLFGGVHRESQGWGSRFEGLSLFDQFEDIGRSLEYLFIWTVERHMS
jgi:hypothetical protein